MTSSYIIFGTVFGAAVISIIIGILAWVSLHAVNSKIAVVEQEIQKKAMEFDLLKKNIPHGGPTGNQFAPAARTDGPETGAEHDNADTTIHVVRNVRNSSDDPSGSHLEDDILDISPLSQTRTKAPAEMPVHAAHSPSPEQSPMISREPSTGAAIPGHAPAINANVQPFPDTTTIISPDTAPSNAGQERAPGNKTIVVSVYSIEKKDADFAYVSSVLRETYRQQGHSHITLDFSRVLFLYDQELSYLQSVEEYARKRNVQLSFINTESELRDILRNHSQLAHCIRD